MFEDVRGGLGGHHVVDDQLAERGQKVAPLVQLFALGVLVLLLCGSERSGQVAAERQLRAGQWGPGDRHVQDNSDLPVADKAIGQVVTGQGLLMLAIGRESSGPEEGEWLGLVPGVD